jgi:hypothetical protein
VRFMRVPSAGGRKGKLARRLLSSSTSPQADAALLVASARGEFRAFAPRTGEAMGERWMVPEADVDVVACTVLAADGSMAQARAYACVSVAADVLSVLCCLLNVCLALRADKRVPVFLSQALAQQQCCKCATDRLACESEVWRCAGQERSCKSALGRRLPGPTQPAGG